MHFSPTRAPRKARFPQELALTAPHALARIRRPSLPNDPNGRYASRTRPRTAHPYPCRVRHSQAPLSRRPALPGRDRKRLCPHSCPVRPFADPPPPTCAFSAQPKTACPRICPVHPFADPPPPTCASPARPKTACPPSCRVRHSQAPLSRRPALPCATENSLPTLLPRPPFADPLPADLRFSPHATANVPARGISQAPVDGLRPSGMALAVPPRHVGQKMFKFYNSLKIALSPVDSGMHACYNVPSGYPVVCATPVLLPTDSKKDSGSVSVDVMPPISDRPGKAANGRRSPPCLSGG